MNWKSFKLTRITTKRVVPHIYTLSLTPTINKCSVCNPLENLINKNHPKCLRCSECCRGKFWEPENCFWCQILLLDAMSHTNGLTRRFYFIKLRNFLSLVKNFDKSFDYNTDIFRKICRHVASNKPFENEDRILSEFFIAQRFKIDVRLTFPNGELFPED